jgi:thiol:disulfide interchange protein DsbD
MACLPTSTGSTPKPPRRRRGRPERRDSSPAPRRLRAGLVGLAAAVAFAASAQDPELLAPERAFGFSVRALDASTVEARFAIADGYYLYREKLKFGVEPAALAAPPALPAGKVKEDPYFGRVETYRGRLVVRLALAAPAPGSRVTVNAESQGCADIGVCYPPQAQKLTVVMPASGAGPGEPVEFAPAKKRWFN